ncbi:MAG: hypothetical protein WD801_06270 [Gemmatimonadaceae bacterium]
MRNLVTIALCATAACAPAGTPATPVTAAPEAQTVRVSSASGTGSISTWAKATEVRSDTVAVSLQRAWRALPAVYRQLEIPISTFDAAKNQVGHSGYKTYRRIGKIQMTKILDCGRTQIGQNAESYEVVLSVLTTLSGANAAGPTTISTSIQARARPIQFAGDYVSCQSKGHLEEQIALAFKAQFTP